MKIPINFPQILRGLPRRALSTAAATGLLACSTLSHADLPITLAPPVDADATQTVAAGPAYVTPNSVFNWTEMPRNLQVLITHAIFDRGGYQLYDTAGETVVVPFTNNNLYVMKFARSNDGRMYLVNEGDAPVLYVPDGGFLDNATVPGARWYPFSDGFQPAQPVYIGIAPSWPDYVNMGWYPGMICSGGFYGYNPFYPGAVFLPTIGFIFEFGGHRFRDFDDFRDFHRHHPAPFRTGFHDRDVYTWAHHPETHRFETAGGSYFAHRPFRGTQPSFFAHRTFSGNRTLTDQRHVFSGNPSSIEQRRTFPNSRPPLYQHRTFQGSQPPMTDGRQALPGNRAPIYPHRTFQTMPPPAVNRPVLRSSPPVNGNGGDVFNRGMPEHQGATYNRGVPANQGATYSHGMPGGQGIDDRSRNDGNRGFGGDGRRGR